MAVEQDVIDNIQRDVDGNVQQLQGSKLDGFLLLTQIDKRNGTHSIDGYCQRHSRHVGRVVAISQEVTDRHNEQQDQYREQRGSRADTDKRRRKHTLRVLTFLIGKAEECGLHTKRQQDEDECRQGVHIGDNAIATTLCRHLGSIEWHQQIIEESAYDAR